MDKDYTEKLSYHLYNSISVFASLFKFQKDFTTRINSNNNDDGQKLILLSKNWFTEYKRIYLYKKIKDIVEKNKLSLANTDEKKILFNNIFKSFASINKNKKLLLFYNIDEFPKTENYIQNSNIYYISEFEIINEEIYNNLKKHMGEFKDNIISGKGTYTTRNGDIYIGIFINGLINGKGTLIYKNGDKYEGEFKNGKRDGEGSMYDKEGNLINKGIWIQDKYIN